MAAVLVDSEAAVVGDAEAKRAAGAKTAAMEVEERGDAVQDAGAQHGAASWTVRGELDAARCRAAARARRHARDSEHPRATQTAHRRARRWARGRSHAARRRAARAGLTCQSCPRRNSRITSSRRQSTGEIVRPGVAPRVTDVTTSVHCPHPPSPSGAERPSDRRRPLMLSKPKFRISKLAVKTALNRAFYSNNGGFHLSYLQTTPGQELFTRSGHIHVHVAGGRTKHVQGGGRDSGPRLTTDGTGEVGCVHLASVWDACAHVSCARCGVSLVAGCQPRAAPLTSQVPESHRAASGMMQMTPLEVRNSVSVSAHASWLAVFGAAAWVALGEGVWGARPSGAGVRAEGRGAEGVWGCGGVGASISRERASGAIAVERT